MSEKDADLPVFVKWLEFVEWLFPATAKFPRSVRFSLATRIEGIALDVVEDLVTARYDPQRHRLLQEINLRLDKLRILLRLSFCLHYLALNSYEHASRQIDETGRMLGGWLKQRMKDKG